MTGSCHDLPSSIVVRVQKYFQEPVSLPPIDHTPGAIQVMPPTFCLSDQPLGIPATPLKHWATVGRARQSDQPTLSASAAIKSWFAH
jgi:hypothetical protein